MQDRVIINEHWSDQLEQQLIITQQFQQNTYSELLKDFNMIQEVFKQQQDSSFMLETLIQDLLDLAKIDNK
jgi:signal transduction histidine kinase